MQHKLRYKSPVSMFTSPFALGKLELNIFDHGMVVGDRPALLSIQELLISWDMLVF